MNLYKMILQKFPPKITYSFAYGSGVKPQLGYKKSSKLIDLIFCVENPDEWHKNNIIAHSDHYSGLKYFGNKFISSYQQNSGAKIYYNTLVNLKDLNINIKYGIISIENLINDLTNWDYLYIAGRLHKPVYVITTPDNTRISNALENNLRSALRTALLLLPEKFTDYQLFYCISTLSYAGDFRMIFGENKNKVENIVKPQLNDFYQLYFPIINKMSQSMTVLDSDEMNKVFKQDKSRLSIINHLNSLPTNLKEQIKRRSKVRGSIEDVFKELYSKQNYEQVLKYAINDIVWKSSIYQSVKNIPTAGIIKTFKYSWAKAMKTFS